MIELLSGITPITDLNDAWAHKAHGSQARALRVAAERLHERAQSGPRVVSVRTFSLGTLPYPTKYAFQGVVRTLSPFVLLTHRAVLVQFLQQGELKHLLFNPSDIEAARQTPYFMRLAATLPSAIEHVTAKRYESLETQMARVGIANADIDYVAFDHFHTQDVRPLLGTIDGRWKARFPKSVLLAPQCEWDDWDNLHPWQAAWFIADGKRDVSTARVAFTSGDLQLGDGVMLLRTPGHTSGNQTLFLNTESGIWGISENGTSADNWSPLESRLPGMREMCRRQDLDLIINSNTPEFGATQYNSMILERTLVDRVRANPRFVQMFPSSEFTAHFVAPRLRPTWSHGAIESGVVVRPTSQAATAAE